jgi:hypothetical protein
MISRYRNGKCRNWAERIVLISAKEKHRAEQIDDLRMRVFRELRKKENGVWTRQSSSRRARALLKREAAYWILVAWPYRLGKMVLTRIILNWLFRATSAE